MKYYHVCTFMTRRLIEKFGLGWLWSSEANYYAIEIELDRSDAEKVLQRHSVKQFLSWSPPLIETENDRCPRNSIKE